MHHPFPLTFLLILASSLMVSRARSEERDWTSADGRKVKGEITSFEDDQVTLKTVRGDFKFPLSKLSEADQTFAREWDAARMKKAAAGEDPKQPAGPRGGVLGDFSNLKLGVWPTSASAQMEDGSIKVVKEDKEAGEYIYHTPHFEFISPLRLSTSVVREFAGIFEATYEFMKIIPIGLDPKPSTNGFYQTKLFETKEAYYSDGGMPGSGGMHSSSWRGLEILSSLIRVPLENLGVEYTGVRYIVDHKKQSDTLTHEITHQLTGRWLIVTPVWFKEGLAETVSSQKYDNGTFRLTRMEKGITDQLAKRNQSDREFSMVPLEKLMTMSSQEWAAALSGSGQMAGKNYQSANFLFYYFLKLEGAGDGARLVNYMKALSEGKPEPEASKEVLLEGRSYEDLQTDVAQKWRNQIKLKFE